MAGSLVGDDDDHPDGDEVHQRGTGRDVGRRGRQHPADGLRQPPDIAITCFGWSRGENVTTSAGRQVTLRMACEYL